MALSRFRRYLYRRRGRSRRGCRARPLGRAGADADGHDGGPRGIGPQSAHRRGSMAPMSDPGEVWAIIPVKETQGAKQRLAPVLSAPLRQALALAMLEDVLEAIAGVKDLGGAILVT